MNVSRAFFSYFNIALFKNTRGFVGIKNRRRILALGEDIRFFKYSLKYESYRKTNDSDVNERKTEYPHIENISRWKIHFQRLKNRRNNIFWPDLD